MRILVLIPSLLRGGAERRVVSLVKGLLERGNEVGVAIFFPAESGVDSFGDSLRELSVDPVDIGPGQPIRRARNPIQWWNMFRSFRRYRKHLRSYQPDLIHSILPSANIFTSVTLRTIPSRIRPKHVMSREGLPTNRVNRPHIGYLEDKLARFADSTLCVCHAIREATVSGPWWRGGEKIAVVHNGIDVDKFAVAQSSSHRKFRKGVVISNLWPAKGHMDLVHALQILKQRERLDGLFIECVGMDMTGFRNDLESEVSRLQLEGSISFVGGRTNVKPHLANADFYLSTSHGEGLSIAMMEAMAAKLPIWATRVGGTPELAHSSFAYLYEANNPEAMANALESMLALSDAVLVEMGEKAHAHLRKSFTADHMVDNTFALYQRLCN